MRCNSLFENLRMVLAASQSFSGCPGQQGFLTSAAVCLPTGIGSCWRSWHPFPRSYLHLVTEGGVNVAGGTRKFFRAVIRSLTHIPYQACHRPYNNAGILTTALWGGCGYFHFTDEETQAWNESINHPSCHSKQYNQVLNYICPS